MRGEDERCATGRVRLALHEDGSTALQIAHDVRVVDDLFADVHGRAVDREGPLDRLDRSLDTRAEPTRGRQEDPLDHRA